MTDDNQNRWAAFTNDELYAIQGVDPVDDVSDLLSREAYAEWKRRLKDADGS
jgi:hypothetical protein